MNKTIFFNGLVALLLVTTISGCGTVKHEVSQTGWKPLFNGKDLSDWIVKIHHHDLGDNYADTFRAEDGVIKVRYDKYTDFGERFAHLYYKQPFSHFHLKLEYRFSGQFHPDAPSYAKLNSGVMFHSQDPRNMNKDQNWPISVEMQFLAELEEGKPRSTGNMCSPGTEVYVNNAMYKGHCLQSSAKTFKPNEWVTAELIVNGNKQVQHVINGDVVLTYEKPKIGGSVVNGFKPEEKIDGKALSSGFIALQGEGHPIEFRNIMIKELTPSNK